MCKFKLIKNWTVLFMTIPLTIFRIQNELRNTQTIFYSLFHFLIAKKVYTNKISHKSINCCFYLGNIPENIHSSSEKIFITIYRYFLESIYRMKYLTHLICLCHYWEYYSALQYTASSRCVHEVSTNIVKYFRGVYNIHIGQV